MVKYEVPTLSLIPVDDVDVIDASFVPGDGNVGGGEWED